MLFSFMTDKWLCYEYSGKTPFADYNVGKNDKPSTHCADFPGPMIMQKKDSLFFVYSQIIKKQKFITT